MATFIPADTSLPTREVAPKNVRKGFQLQELYSLLSCETIEVLTLSGGQQIMIIDEEGKFSDKLRNERATTLVGFATPEQLAEWVAREREKGIVVIQFSNPGPDVLPGETDYIVGDVLICYDNELK